MRRACTHYVFPPFQRFSLFNQGETQPVYSSSPTDDTAVLPVPETNAVGPSEAPEALAPAPAPQSRSWLASLSRRSSTSTPLNELAKQVPPLAAEERPTVPEPARAVAPPSADRLDPSPVPTTSPVLDPHVPGHAVQLEPDIKSIPSKCPWFASSSSSKRPSKLRPMDEPESANDPTRTNSPGPQLPVTNVINVIPPTPPKPELTKVESKNPPESDSVPIPTSRKWFSPVSSVSSRSPDAETRTISPLAVSQASQAGVTSPSTPSSIDDQVPKLPSAVPQLESVAPSVLLSSDMTQNLSALNPSTSRFSLSIPFLGRPKMPLDRAVASVKTADVPRALDIEGSSSQLSGEEPKTEGEEPRVETTGKNSVPISMTEPTWRLRYHSTFRSEFRIHY